jgi:opacity protein-like surface antigen
MDRKNMRWVGLTVALILATGTLGVKEVAARMWVGLQAGPNYMANADIVKRVNAEPSVTYENVKFAANFLGGLTIGYDFVNEGFLGRDWPNWMKYISVALDLTYHNVTFRRQQVTAEIEGKGKVAAFFPNGIIRMFTLVPLIIGKYGFFPDSEVPFGRLQPYLGVGVGLVITDPALDGFTTRERNKVDGVFLLETGLRYMMWQNVSLDAAFRYRLIFTKFGNTYDSPGGSFKINQDWEAHLFNAIFRVAYHF